jgi:hypothetical protein
MKSKKLIFAILIIFLFSLGLFIQGQDYDVEIQKTWGSSGNDFAYSLAVASNNLYLAGNTTSFSGLNVGAFLAKFTLSPFDVVWSKGIQIPRSAFYDVAIDSANVSAVGYARVDTSDRPVIIKLDQANGNLQWAQYIRHLFGSRTSESGKAFSITTFGSYYCLSGFSQGTITGPPPELDITFVFGGIFACFDANGNLNTAYSRFFSTDTFDVTFFPYGIASHSSNLFLAGTTDSSSMRGFIAKYDGTSLLVRTTSDVLVQNITSIAVDNSGNLYITGAYSNSIFLAKLDSNLNVIYTKRIQVTGNEIGYSIALDPSNNIYIGGRKNAQPDQAILVKLDNGGNVIWCKSWGGTGDEGIFKIRVDSNNEVHAAGFSWDINKPLNNITCSVSTISVSFGPSPYPIVTDSLSSVSFTPSIRTVSGNLNSPQNNEALYLKISPVVTTTVTTTTTTTKTVTTTPTATTTVTTTLTTTSTATATTTLTTPIVTTTVTTTTTTTIAGTTVTITACSPILLRVNEIEKINNVSSLNQILYFSLFTSISLTFLFSYMIISNRRKIKWKKQR